MENLLAPSALPFYRNPPVTEVVLSVQFAALPMTSIYGGLFWSRVRNKYPKVTEQPPVDPSFEVFGSSNARPLGMQIQISQMLTFPFPRYQFTSADDHDMCQLQQDHIHHNWRARDGDQPYPRYEYVREQLRADIDTLSVFLKDEKLGELKVNQCAVTYVNTIKLASSDNPHREVAKVLNIANAWPEGAGLPELESTIIQSKAILHGDGEPTCRLHMSLQPVMLKKSKEAAVRLQLVTRGKPNGEDIHEAFALLDFAHAGIVRTFAAITTEDIQKEWGLEYAS